jgi:hypothetical protein
MASCARIHIVLASWASCVWKTVYLIENKESNGKKRTFLANKNEISLKHQFITQTRTICMGV